jgi:hypothetical protein
MPPDLHGELAQAAEREGTSLNGYITARLAESVGRPGSDGATARTGSAVPSSTLTRLLIANVVTVAVAAVAAVVILLVAWLG